MGRGPSVHLRRAQDQIRLMQYLAARCPVPVRRALADLGLTHPDLERFLDRIRMCGLPPYLPHDFADAWIEDGTLHCRFPATIARPTRFTPEEVHAIRLAAAELLAEEGTAYAASVHRLLDRIAGAAGEADAGGTVRTVGRRRGVSDRIGDLDTAIARRQIVVLDYYSQRRDEASRRPVRPYGIAQEDGAWYLVAHCETRKEIRTFRIDRIRRVEPTGRAFTVPDGLDWRGVVADGLYRPSPKDRTVRLRLGARLETWAREHLPAGSLRGAGGGALLHEFPSANPDAVARWVVGLGPDAQVLGPSEFRAAVRRHCEKVFKAHAARGAQ